MITITASSANELFVAACDAILDEGTPVKPRGLPTREVLGAHLVLTDPRSRLVDLPPVRVVNPAFAVAEALWILSGSDGPWIFEYNKSLTRYADHGVLQGAYGPRMRCWHGRQDQLDAVRRQLLKDPDSRQAVIQLFDAEHDRQGFRDVPCTLGYRFFLRDGRLHMHTTMRSQDVWLGLPYDLFAATLLQELLAGWLGAQLGEYRHTIDSLHLYDENSQDALALTDGLPVPEPMALLSAPWDGFDDLLAQVVADDLPPDVPEPWAAFAAVMSSYRLWRGGQLADALTKAEQAAGPLGRALERWYLRISAGSAADARALEAAGEARP
jgi:thymidylate synthase